MPSKVAQRPLQFTKSSIADPFDFEDGPSDARPHSTPNRTSVIPEKLGAIENPPIAKMQEKGSANAFVKQNELKRTLSLSPSKKVVKERIGLYC